MWSINGFGRTFYGKREFDSDGSFITTKWLIFAFIPVSPAHSARVRVIDSLGPVGLEYEILEELPVCWKQALCVYAYVFGLIPLTIHFGDKFRWSNFTQFLALTAVALVPFVVRRIAHAREA